LVKNLKHTSALNRTVGKEPRAGGGGGGGGGGAGNDGAVLLLFVTPSPVKQANPVHYILKLA
jgi:hypothetical protein